MIVLYRGGIASKEQEATSAERGMSYAVIEGIQKIRVAGAEKRAFARWANLYADEVGYTYNANPFARALPVVNTAVTSIGTAVIFWIAANVGRRLFGKGWRLPDMGAERRRKSYRSLCGFLRGS